MEDKLTAKRWLEIKNSIRNRAKGWGSL